MKTDVAAFLHDLDRQSIESRARTRQIIFEAGRPDVLADFDRQMKEIDNGVSGAKGCWHALSSKQRFVLRLMGQGRYLSRSLRSPAQFDAFGRSPAMLNVCRLSTARKLCAHELIHVNGGVADPEDVFVITERGQFVLKHGDSADAMTSQNGTAT